MGGWLLVLQTCTLSPESTSNMKAVILLIVASVAFAQEGKILEWTITGNAFEACVAPREALTFVWDGPFHNVEKVNKAGYDNCDGFDNTEGVEGPYVFSNRNEGTYYFVCGVGGHCAGGNQKAKVTVSKTC